MKEIRLTGVIYGLVVACLLFTLGYILGSGSARTQVEVTVAEPIRVVTAAETEDRAAPPAGVLDLNMATEPELEALPGIGPELEALPGIGPELARRIAEYRQEKGGFSSPEQLMEVQGIGEKRYAALRDLIKVGGAP